MYELLLKWGLDNLTGLANLEAGHELDITLEAIRAKNLLITKRYEQAFAAHQDLVDLTLELEDRLGDFRKTSSQTDGTFESSKKFVGELREQVHPEFYRRFRKIRSQFDSTNDLLSSYSIVFTEIVHIEYLQKVYKVKNEYSGSSILRIYRGQWVKLAEIVASLLRISSSDLRFWITDAPYAVHAEHWAKRDLAKVNQFFEAEDWGGMHFRLSLEKRDGLTEFWDSFLSDSEK